MVEGPALDLVMSLFPAVTLFMVMLGLSGLSSFFWLNLEVFGIPLTLFLHGKYNSNTFGLLGSLPSVVVDNWDLTLSICSCFSMYLTLVIFVIYLQKNTNLLFKIQDSKAPSKKRSAISRKWEQTKGFFQYEFTGFISEYEIRSKRNGPVFVPQE